MDPPKYSLERFSEDLGGIPSEHEFLRLIDHYPEKYERAPRKGLVIRMLEGGDEEDLIVGYRSDKGKDGELPQGSTGGLTTSFRTKLMRMAIRILFLRYCIDEGHTKRKANARILQKGEWGFKSVQDVGQSSISHVTRGSKLFAK